MKKLAMAGLVLIVMIGAIVILKSRNGPQNDLPRLVSERAVAIEHYLAQNPSEPAAAPLQRLAAAMKARPSIQETIVGDVVTRSLQDGSVSAPEAEVLTAAADLAEQDPMMYTQINAFTVKVEQVMGPPGSEADLANVAAIDHYIQTKPSGRGIPQLKRLVEAHKKRPAQTQVLTRAGAQSVQDGSVTPREASMLKEAAALADRDTASDQDIQTFASKYPAATALPADPAKETSAAATPASKTIDTYLQKHSSGRGVAQLRRLSVAMKSRPTQVQKIAETAARRIEDGSVSKDDAEMLDEAVTLAEDEGLTAKEMAEFSQKYARGIGLSQKPESARISEQVESKPLASFEGKRQLNYTFRGNAQCPGKPCSGVRVNVRVTSGQWVESRQGGLDPQGQYLLEMPVLSATNEKVAWHLEAHSNDLRKAELDGQRRTVANDHDVDIQNNLVLQPASDVAK
jgi:hypothetical protein